MTDRDITDPPTDGPPDDEWALALFPPVGSTEDPRTRKVGALVQWLKKKLTPATEDLFGAFQPASGFLDAGTTYRTGGWCIATNASGAPTAADSANLSEISSGDYTLVLSTRLRNDADPDIVTYAAELQVSGFERGDVVYLHAQDPYNAADYLEMTLTDVASLVGAGDAAYIWVPVTIVEVGNVTDDSDWYRYTEELPADIEIDQAVVSGMSALLARLLTALQSAGDLLERWRKTIQGNNESRTLSVVRKAGTPAAAGQIGADGLSGGVGQILFWPPAASKDGTPFLDADLEAFKSGDFMRLGDVEWQIGANPWNEFSGSVLQASVQLAPGYTWDAADLPALDAAADLTLEGRDIHLGLVASQILKRATQNVGGKGGAAGKVWSWISSSTDAAWRRLLDTLKADADTAAKKADYKAALATGRLDIDIAGNGDRTLTAAEASYDHIRLFGARTGDGVLTLPAAPSGLIVIDRETTGSYDVSVKAAGQSDAAAITIFGGDNVVVNHGGSMAHARSRFVEVFSQDISLGADYAWSGDQTPSHGLTGRKSVVFAFRYNGPWLAPLVFAGPFWDALGTQGEYMWELVDVNNNTPIFVRVRKGTSGDKFQVTGNGSGKNFTVCKCWIEV